MDVYAGFSEVYDELMDDIPYDAWAAFALKSLAGAGVEYGSTVVELGCGTGAFTTRFSKAGYSMLAIDQSADMLSAAYDKAADAGETICFVEQDMRELELPGQYPAFVSFCDCVNYILEEEELLGVFKSVMRYLEPGGCFFFDFNTRYKYETVMNDCVIAENRDSVSFIWENSYDAESRINEYDVTFFVRDDERAGEELFRKYEELHLQKGYEPQEIYALLEEAGFSVEAAYDEYKDIQASDTSERVCVLSRKERE